MDKAEKLRGWEAQIKHDWEEMQADDAMTDKEGGWDRAGMCIEPDPPCENLGEWIEYLKLVDARAAGEARFEPDGQLWLTADWPRLDEQDFMEMKQDAREEAGT